MGMDAGENRDMLWIMILCSILANGCGAGLLFNEIRKNQEKFKGWKDGKPPGIFLFYGGCMIILAIGLSVFITVFYRGNTFLFTLKRTVLLALLWPIAYTDFVTYRIPNRFIVGGFCGRAAILAAELIFARENLIPVLLGEVIASLALFLAAGICTLIAKNSIGGGDLKLFLVMGLFLGLQGTWSAVFLSLIVSFVIAVVLLATKKKSRKDAIPFGPALMIGTYMSIFLTGM